MTEHHGFSHEEWLAQSWPPGAIFAGGCDSTGAVHSRCVAEGDPAHISMEAWATLNEAVAQLEAHGCGNQRTAWTFETANLWIARREDGSWVGVFTALRLSDSSYQVIDSRLNEFLGKATAPIVTEQPLPA